MNFDISWDEVAKYVVASPQTIARVAAMLNKLPGPVPVRHRRGRAGERGRRTSRVFDMWAPVWRQLTPEASLKVRKGNYERLFDEGAGASARGNGQRQVRRSR